MSQQTLRRVIHPEIKFVDKTKGIVEYIASDETVDSYREIVKADGWVFDLFKKNAPFVDSHDYSSIDKQVGKVLDFNVTNKQLVETVQWAIDVAENKLAQLGWKMTEGGYLKAVSVGFFPVTMINRWDQDTTTFNSLCLQAGADPNIVRTIYTKQRQIELSSCIIGANPNALAKALKDQCVTETDLLSLFQDTPAKTSSSAQSPGADELSSHRARSWFLERINRARKRL